MKISFVILYSFDSLLTFVFASLVTKHISKTTAQAVCGNQQETCPAKPPVMESYKSGTCADGSNDLSIYDMHYGRCVDECRARPACTAVNVYSKIKLCRINFQTGLTTRKCPKHIYSEKANWKQKSKLGCESLTCSATQRCEKLGDKYTCVTSECPNTKFEIENGYVSGNQVTFGETRRFWCKRGYTLIGSKKIRCQTDGTWSDNAPICSGQPNLQTNPSSSAKVTISTTTAANGLSKTPSSNSKSTTTELTMTMEATTSQSSGITTETSTTIAEITASPSPSGSTLTATENTTTTEETTSTSSTNSKDTMTKTTTEKVKSTSSGTGMSSHSAYTTPGTNSRPTNTNRSKPTTNSGLYAKECNGTGSSYCSQLFQECRNNKCRCKFGTVYDYGKGSCAKACRHLGRTYQVHYNVQMEDESLSKIKDEWIQVTGDENCIQICSNLPTCSSATVVADSLSDDGVQQTTDYYCRLYTGPIPEESVPGQGYTTYLRDCLNLTYNEGQLSTPAENTMPGPKCEMGYAYSIRQQTCLNDCDQRGKYFDTYNDVQFVEGTGVDLLDVLTEISTVAECYTFCLREKPQCSVVQSEIRDQRLICSIFRTDNVPKKGNFKTRQFSEYNQLSVHVRSCDYEFNN